MCTIFYCDILILAYTAGGLYVRNDKQERGVEETLCHIWLLLRDIIGIF